MYIKGIRFYGRICQVGSVGWALLLFCFIFIISGSKNDLKWHKFWIKVWHFLQENFEKIFWLVFKNFQLKFLDFGQKRADYKILEKLEKKKEKKNLPTTENWGGSRP